MKHISSQTRASPGSHIRNTHAPPFCQSTATLETPCCVILENISDGVFTIDLHKRITSFNRGAQLITGFKGEEALGQFCFDIFRADICERRCALDETLSSGHPRVQVPASIITKTGERKPISISTSILRDKEGEIIGGVETFRDLSEIENLRRQLAQSFTHEDIIGRHFKIREIISSLPDIAESGSPILIEGPTGSGKELIARAIHTLSPRKGGPFVAVNCAALPDTLLESELFGYAKGAFTGALKKKPGRFLLANQGTLFLDEISNTSMAFQADLLRVLEGHEFIPLGGTTPIKVDFRTVAASNVPLKRLIREEKFREDLYYRLNVVKISLPPLRERREDIPLLIDHFIRRFNLLKEKAIQGISREALSLLMQYPFPGNIRELENIIEYAFIYCKQGMIGLEHLPEELLEDSRDHHHAFPNAPPSLQNEEAQRVYAALTQWKWKRQETARALGISRSTLWRRMKKYRLLEAPQKPLRKGPSQ